MKEYLIPVFVGMVLGVSTSFATTKYTEGGNEVRFTMLEKQIEGMQVIMRAVQVNQVQIESSTQQIINVKNHLDRVDNNLLFLESNMFTQKDAEREHRIIRLESDAKHRLGN